MTVHKQYLSFINHAAVVCLLVSIDDKGWVQKINGKQIDPTPIEDYANEFPVFVTTTPIDMNTYQAMLENLDKDVPDRIEWC